ncbi:MAG: hypothetical protein HETSPECPRED_005706 [Heterodermia speciosa]|uniref:FAD dependent oxidoreductase domain-containing protein n=1 Tax=Heterodermia speciosa TaxID=116794 RepID=A0A8H3FK87_9LECA|nr:MAG: hypothetical protein HETSPECPRED_005706 [Heterodermia speciosa]
MSCFSIAIIGAGWTGCHLALELAKAGHRITLFDKGNEILSGVSGHFGIRLHRGPHYPRSRQTRENCHASFSKFSKAYPDLVVGLDESIYAHGASDALGQPSKLSSSAFRSICYETAECCEVDPQTACMTDVTAAFELEEPCVVIGPRLRTDLNERLTSSSVDLRIACEITSLRSENGHINLSTSTGNSVYFDKVVNASGYQSLLPLVLQEHQPLHAEVYYQVCLGLTYFDSSPSAKPISKIVMDGWYPCLMPMITDDEQPQRRYLITHGSYTIMGSCNKPDKAEALLQSLTDDYIHSHVRIPTETEMARFWPGFTDRFNYVGWKGVVQAKLKTRSEFRSAVTFEHDGIIYVFPGKISNIFDAYDETQALLTGTGCVESDSIRYPTSGVLALASSELKERLMAGEANTGNLRSES